MAKELGLAAVAEGIERPDQQIFLMEIGCPFGQGFLFGRPSPAAIADGWLDMQPGL